MQILRMTPHYSGHFYVCDVISDKAHTQVFKRKLPGISVPFENYAACVITSTGSKQRDYIITQNACTEIPGTDFFSSV